jgi:hypothetical protein
MRFTAMRAMPTAYCTPSCARHTSIPVASFGSTHRLIRHVGAVCAHHPVPEDKVAAVVAGVVAVVEVMCGCAVHVPDRAPGRQRERQRKPRVRVERLPELAPHIKPEEHHVGSQQKRPDHSGQDVAK